MRILVVSDLPHFVTGGAEMQAMRLIEAWLDQGHEVVCVGRRMGKGPVAIGRHRVIIKRIRTLRYFGRWVRALTYVASLFALLVTYRRWADVIYTRFLGEAAVTAALARRLGVLDVPLVATPANTLGQGDIAFIGKLPLADRLFQLLDRECAAINLIAPGMADELIIHGFSGQNFSFIPNGIAVHAPCNRGTPPNKPRFIAVGRLAHQKGYDVLVRAVARIKDHISPAQFSIVGAGPEHSQLRNLAATLGVAKSFEWLGELKSDSVRMALEQAQVFLLPSRYEGMSNAGLEAMERGLPLIVTRCHGLDRYVTPDMGWLVDPDDEQALANALLDALAKRPEELTKMGGRCRDLVERDFDISRTAARYGELFLSVRSNASNGR